MILVRFPQGEIEGDRRTPSSSPAARVASRFRSPCASGPEGPIESHARLTGSWKAERIDQLSGKG